MEDPTHSTNLRYTIQDNNPPGYPDQTYTISVPYSRDQLFNSATGLQSIETSFRSQHPMAVTAGQQLTITSDFWNRNLILRDTPSTTRNWAEYNKTQWERDPARKKELISVVVILTAVAINFYNRYYSNEE